MIIMAAVDENNGMMFNHRRQSQDRVLRQKMEELSKESELRMNSYSAQQFDPLPVNAVVSEDFLSEAGTGEFCFAEDQEIFPVRDRIESVILFHWNRKYPSDFKLDFLPSEQGMQLVETEDFAGYSHEKITMEVWEWIS